MGSWFVAASEEGREKSKVRSYPFRLIFCGLNNDNMKLVRCSILRWWCVILLKCVLVQTNIVKLSKIENSKKYQYTYYKDEDSRKYSEERQGRYYDVVRQKLLQQHRQAESSEVSDDVPVTAQYPFVEQITNAIRRIATVVQDYLYEFSQSYLPSDGAIARIISVISNPGNAISDTCYDHSDCKYDSNVCLMGRCVCGQNGVKCSRTNPTCDRETGVCQCGKRKNRWGGPYTLCYIGQICTVHANMGKCR